MKIVLIPCLDCENMRHIDAAKNNPQRYQEIYTRCRVCAGKYYTNTGQFTKGSSPWSKGTKGLVKPNSGNFKKGQRVSPETEFKYKNGMGYRNLMLKGVLPQYCQACLDEPLLNRLHVHHKDRNRSNNALNNLVTLCRPCHLREHGRTERVYVEGRKAAQ